MTPLYLLVVGCGFSGTTLSKLESVGQKPVYAGV